MRPDYDVAIDLTVSRRVRILPECAEAECRSTGRRFLLDEDEIRQAVPAGIDLVISRELRVYGDVRREERGPFVNAYLAELDGAEVELTITEESAAEARLILAAEAEASARLEGAGA